MTGPAMVWFSLFSCFLSPGTRLLWKAKGRKEKSRAGCPCHLKNRFSRCVWALSRDTRPAFL